MRSLLSPTNLIPLALAAGVVGFVVLQRKKRTVIGTPPPNTGQLVDRALELAAIQQRLVSSALERRSAVLFRAWCNSNTCPVYATPDVTVPFVFITLPRGRLVYVVEVTDLWARVRLGPQAGPFDGWIPRAFLNEEPHVTPEPSGGSSPFGGRS